MKKRIVVVDDQVAILEVVQLALEMAGYEVETSQTGACLQGMHQPFPDLILLDIFLEGEDGRDICRKLKADEETRHIPVILLSAHANGEQAMRDCNSDDFLAKPFHLDAFYRVVNRYINESETEVMAQKKAAGFDVDLITAIAQHLGLQAHIVSTRFDTIL